MRLERHPTGRATPPYGAGSAATGLRSVRCRRPKKLGSPEQACSPHSHDLTLADDGLYKLWRDGAGGWYTVEIQWSQAQKGIAYQLIFTCRANDSWDDLSDEC